VQHVCPVGEDKGEIGVGRRHLPHTRQPRQDNLLGLALDDLECRHSFDPLLRDQTSEGGRFEDAEPDVKPNWDHDDAEKKGSTPSPGEELVAGNRAEDQHR
jgi:hypothetical protein